MNDAVRFVYHATALSNFARGYDKYAAAYDKSRIPQSTYPDRFFVLPAAELGSGITKAERLVVKTGLSGDRVIVLRGPASGRERANDVTGTGVGLYIDGTVMPVDSVFYLDPDSSLVEVSVEEAYAASLLTLSPELPAYAALSPRSLSVLPVARACQAKCAFCFSETSASIEQVTHSLDEAEIEKLAVRAKALGAERFVITGGGEPGLLPHDQLLGLMDIGRRHFGKTVMITNGIHLTRRPATIGERIADYVDAGLNVLSISRHHDDADENARIMGIDTRTEVALAVLAEGRSRWPALRIRLVCVIQQGGVEDDASIGAYLDYAADSGVDEVCFKELYVSTTLESVYHGHAENVWSREHQVSLSRVTSFMDRNGFDKVAELPWGSPVYAGPRRGRRITVAAYTEPSMFWERANGIARSWNVMADGTCLVSLEDPESIVI